MKFKNCLYIIIFLLAGNIFSQNFPSDKELNKINKRYIKEINLSKETSKKFKEILFLYNKKLVNLDSTTKNYNNEVNKIVKLFDLEVFKLLSKSDFEKFKKIKIIIEPHKKYRL